MIACLRLMLNSTYAFHAAAKFPFQEGGLIIAHQPLPQASGWFLAQ